MPGTTKLRAMVVAMVFAGLMLACRGGSEPTESSAAPGPVPNALAEQPPQIPGAVFADGIWSCAPIDSGNTRCWGGRRQVEDPGRSRYPAGAVQVLESGRAHSCMLIAEGEVWCWGGNGAGALGQPASRLRASFRDRRHVDLPAAAVDLSTARDHTCAVLEDTTVWCWGGAYATGPEYVPQPLEDWTGVERVWAGRAGVCARFSDQSVQCARTFGRLPLSEGPQPDLAGLVELTFGDGHACMLASDGSVSCAGGNGHGQLGIGRRGRAGSFTQIDAPGPWISVAAGHEFTCAVHADETVYCWGADARGQLGRAVEGAEAEAGAVDAEDGAEAAEEVAEVAPGEDDPDGASMRLPARFSPQPVAGLSGVQHVSAGDVHACAFGEGRAWCWGGNGHAQIGDGTRADAFAPVDAFAGR